MRAAPSCTIERREFRIASSPNDKTGIQLLLCNHWLGDRNDEYLIKLLQAGLPEKLIPSHRQHAAITRRSDSLVRFVFATNIFWTSVARHGGG